MNNFEVPNLDGLNDDELREVDRTYTALAIITDAMIRARALRLKGDIDAALSFERFADARIKKLPQWARW